MFTYVGSFSFTMSWVNTSRPELGACHADDLLYLLSTEAGAPSPLVTEEDRQVRTFIFALEAGE